MAFRSWLRAMAASPMGMWLTPIIGWTFVVIDEFLFDEYIFGNITVWCNNTFVALVSPMIGEGPPFWFGRTAGALVAFLIILPIAAIMCRVYLSWYDFWKVNWLGIEGLKDLAVTEKSGWWTKFRLWVMSWGELPSLVVLSLWKDAFVTTAFLRKQENRYDGLTKRDWGIFRASLLISVGYWSLRWSFITLVVQFIFPYFPPWLQQPLLWLWEKNVEFLNWIQTLLLHAGQYLLEMIAHLIAHMH